MQIYVVMGVVTILIVQILIAVFCFYIAGVIKEIRNATIIQNEEAELLRIVAVASKRIETLERYRLSKQPSEELSAQLDESEQAWDTITNEYSNTQSP